MAGALKERFLVMIKITSVPPREPIRVGIAGLGRSGWDIHAQFIATLPERFTLAAVYDPNAARMQEARERFGAAPCATLEQLLARTDVELVVIATPSHLHPEHAIQALHAGRHVICEKPLAGSVAEADAMIAAAERGGRQLFPFQQKRYDKDFIAVKRIIDSGAIGRPTLIRIAYHSFGRRWDWQTLKQFRGGSLANTGPHPIDHALVLFGGGTPTVTCDLRRTLTLGDAEDHVKVTLSGADSPTIEIEIMATSAWPVPRWLVMGTQGGIVGGPDKLDYKYFDPAALPARQLDPKPTPDRSYNSEAYPWVQKTWLASDDPSPGSVQFYHDVFAALRENVPMPITPQQVRAQIHVIEQCKQQSPLYQTT